MAKLADLLEDQLQARMNNRKGPKKLDKVLDMSKTQMSSTIGLGQGVDLESINKGKASRVDVKKLEKQEAKLRAKIEKRARRDLYEGSKLLDSHKKQQTYEEMFMKINSLEASNAGKNKSKDIHLPSIDVNFGSNRILSGASLTLAYGRRYGLIGRNGVGKSTLLRHIALREVPIPAHITILFVEQEIVGDDTTALESVLKADVWRDSLLREEADLNARLSELDKEGDDKRFEDAREEASARLADVHARLSDMEAESGPARAASLLAGLGFSEADEDRGRGVGGGRVGRGRRSEEGEGGVEGARRRGVWRRGFGEGGSFPKESDALATRVGEAPATMEGGREEGRATVLNSHSFVYT
ncbi:hypothetical protein EV715DRAFT_268616 [Schizophyllum commune]